MNRPVDVNVFVGQPCVGDLVLVIHWMTGPGTRSCIVVHEGRLAFAVPSTETMTLDSFLQLARCITWACISWEVELHMVDSGDSQTGWRMAQQEMAIQGASR